MVEKWRGVPGSLVMILHEIQKHFRYVPRQAAFEISRVLDVPLARIYEVLTFYNYFKLEAPGKHQISVCMGTACYLKGAPQLLSEIKRILNVEEEHSTTDGLFHLQVVRCLGCCGLAPVITIDDTVHGKVQVEQIHGILAEYMKKNEEVTA
ncbi:MAG: NAD(P)H-dependent oxidoreductase subunit E [Candidatus Omnitrophica bacterium]|nr:NAD(P)H-dependent oxidoreductase subunit E [Candidatus Omnitrophota bacterium]